MDRPLIRQQLREQRRRVSAEQRAHAAKQLAESFQTHALLNNVQHLAYYLAYDGEIDPALVAELAQQMHITCYLPVLVQQQLIFAAYQPGEPWITNRYGIPEPQQREKIITPQQLDAVIVPLVGFDLQGNRLGMGQGNYDRTFAFMHEVNPPQKPLLIGVAYEFQQLEKIPAKSWDVPLHVIVTDKNVVRCT